MYNIIDDMSPTLVQTFGTCAFQKMARLCKSIFTSVYTDDGHCFVFNELNSHEMYTAE